VTIEEPELPTEDARGASSPVRRDTSGPAIAATVALVLFSVFIGVFGPRLGNRPQSPAGVTLVELAEAVVSRSQAEFGELRAERIEGTRTDELTDDEFAQRFDRITDAAVALPSLDALGLEALSVRRVRLPGGAGGFAVLRGRGGRTDAVASIAVIADEDRFTVYDRYGRPTAMPEGEIFSVPDRMSLPPGTVEMYREGGHVVAVYARNLEDARELLAAIRQAEVERRARRVGD
jgi:hypothetical protein